MSMKQSLIMSPSHLLFNYAAVNSGQKSISQTTGAGRHFSPYFCFAKKRTISQHSSSASSSMSSLAFDSYQSFVHTKARYKRVYSRRTSLASVSNRHPHAIWPEIYSSWIEFTTPPLRIIIIIIIAGCMRIPAKCSYIIAEHIV